MKKKRKPSEEDINREFNELADIIVEFYRESKLKETPDQTPFEAP